MASDWPLIAIRFAQYLALAVLFGLAAFARYGLREDARGGALPLRPWLAGSAIAGGVVAAAWLAVVAAAMAGTPPWPVDREAVAGLLAGTAIGTAWQVRMAALAVAAIAAVLGGRLRHRLAIVTVAAAVALATLAWTGHGAMDEGAIGWLHLAADILHLVASAAWVGALLGLVLLVTRRADRVDAAHVGLTQRALHGFGVVGTIIVATIVVTGAVNTLTLVGVANLPALATTLYGQLLLAKLTLFVAMLGLAALNRFRLTPSLARSMAAGDHRDAVAKLRSSLIVESACVIAVLALVAWLGTMAPPASAM